MYRCDHQKLIDDIMIRYGGPGGKAKMPKNLRYGEIVRYMEAKLGPDERRKVLNQLTTLVHRANTVARDKLMANKDENDNNAVRGFNITLKFKVVKVR